MKKIQILFAAIVAVAMVACNTPAKTDGDEKEDHKECEHKEDKKCCDHPKEDGSCCVKPNTLSEKEKEEGWVLLFDGKTSNGWHGYNKDGFPDQGWEVKDGKLTVLGSGHGEAGGKGGDIITDKTYKDFEFTVEWMVSDSANSGIFFMVIEDEEARIFHSAPEMQVLDDNGHPDAHNPDPWGEFSHRAGSLYDLIKAPDGAFKGANKWNKAYIKKQGDKVTFKLNDVVTAEFTLWDDAWNEMVAKSKFNEWELFGSNKEAGNIGLQDHGDTVHFRNIKIKEL